MQDRWELVIFDCDGVLVDSERLIIPICLKTLGARGWQITEAQVIERFVGRRFPDFYLDVVEALGPSSAAEWDVEMHALFREAVECSLVPVDGVIDALDRIQTQTCVASGASHESLRLELGRVGLWSRFEGRIFSAREVARGKPAPDLFLHAARRMGVDPSACAVIEDSLPGVRAAQAAGMTAFGYVGGVTAPEILGLPGVITFSSMRDLPGLLANASRAAIEARDL